MPRPHKTSKAYDEKVLRPSRPAQSVWYAHKHAYAGAHGCSRAHAHRGASYVQTQMNARTQAQSKGRSTCARTWSRSRWKRRRAPAAAVWAMRQPCAGPRRCWGSRPQGPAPLLGRKPGPAAPLLMLPAFRAGYASPAARRRARAGEPVVRSVANDATEGCSRRRRRAVAWGAMAGGDRPRDARIVQPRDASFVLRIVFCVGQQMLGIGLLFYMPR